MGLNVQELIAAIPEEVDEAAAPQELFRDLLGGQAVKPIPIGRFSRFWSLSSLQAKIAIGYLVWWIRSGYAREDEKARQLNEANLRAAIKLLRTMGYMRGSVMKVGQMLATYPDVAPEHFVDVLGKLYFEAPPMHFSLLREQVRNELGDDPESVFAEFDTRAFAAASLGQVHRARLKTGEPVAVKIQYPNIARTIRDDYRNFSTLVAPMRLTGDWENLKKQWEDVRAMIELETDYVQEADSLETARAAFRHGEDIVVPRVYRELSTKRVLTMDYIDGRHAKAYLATNPPQAQRDRLAHLIFQSAIRLYYASRMIYADPHPGNYLFMPDGRLGVIDFGCCHTFTDEEWDYVSEVECVCGEDRHGPAFKSIMVRSVELEDASRVSPEHLEKVREWCEWVWEPTDHVGLFDFSNRDYLKRGVDLFCELVRRRFWRSKPVNTWLTRNFVGVRSMAYRLGARVDLHNILASETNIENSSFRPRDSTS